jgi:hypothetical protein
MIRAEPCLGSLERKITRSTRLGRRAAVAVTALGVAGALATAAPAQAAASPSWRVTHVFPLSSQMTGSPRLRRCP